MNNSNNRQLQNLLPAFYRNRDDQLGGLLKSFLAVMGEQLDAVEENIQQLHDDMFIETCAQWVIPYIGDLIGYQALHPTNPTVGIPRAEVAHTIGFRRRKGTASMLEQLARDVTGYEAKVVEFFQLLAWAQNMNHVRPGCTYSPDVRQADQLEKLNSPFDTLSHTVDVRDISLGEGFYNVRNIGIFLWRLFPYRLEKVTAASAKDAPANRGFFFNPLGIDTQLFTRPVERPAEITVSASPENVPAPLTQGVLNSNLAKLYNTDSSVLIENVDIKQVVVCNLEDWNHVPISVDMVAIDPVLGRLFFAQQQAKPPLVTFHYGFSADVGGGEYDRAGSFDPSLQPVVEVGPNGQYASLKDALDNTASGLVEITDNGTYSEDLAVNIDLNDTLEIRASNGSRPLLDTSNRLIQIQAGDGSTLKLNGLVIHGAISLAVDQQLSKLQLAHCTLVPDTAKTLEIHAPDVSVTIDHCITGPLRVSNETTVDISHSIIDAGSPTSSCYTDLSNAFPGGPLQISYSTVIGSVYTEELQLASNTIFVSPVTSKKKQNGCVRFSYIEPVSAVPFRYRCQPTHDSDPPRVRPQFTSLQYGNPWYCQLSRRTATEIRSGAEDESEMGVFHDQMLPQKEANLRLRLDEYLRFGLEAGIFYVT